MYDGIYFEPLNSFVNFKLLKVWKHLLIFIIDITQRFIRPNSDHFHFPTPDKLKFLSNDVADTSVMLGNQEDANLIPLTYNGKRERCILSSIY